MNILLLCNKSPWPPKEGGPIAMNAMVEGLMDAGHSVKVLAINSNKYNIEFESIPEDYRKSTEIELVNVDLGVKAIPALTSFIKNKSYHVERFISKEFTERLIDILQNNHFDIIQLESLFVAPYISVIKENSKASIILRAHNIEHLIWYRIYKKEKNPVKKLYLLYLAKTLKTFELNTIKIVDGIVAITSKDADYFKKMSPEVPVISIPFGIDIKKVGKNGSTIIRNCNELFHLGSMDWIPNQEGLKWFIKEVWSKVIKQKPNLTFRLAGRNMPEWLVNYKATGIIVDGEVPEAREYMLKYPVMVVPLFSGSGIRIKIIEGMLAECAIITTSIGAEGIDYTDGKNIIIANDKSQFVNAIKKLTENNALAQEIGKQARQFVIDNHDNSKLIKNLEIFYLKVNDQI